MAGPDGNPLQRPELPETYWEGPDNSDGVDFRDRVIQKKLMDSIAFSAIYQPVGLPTAYVRVRHRIVF